MKRNTFYPPAAGGLPVNRQALVARVRAEVARAGEAPPGWDDPFAAVPESDTPAPGSCVGDETTRRMDAPPRSEEPSGIAVQQTDDGEWVVTGAGKPATVTRRGTHPNGEPKLACDCKPFQGAVRSRAMRYCTHTGAVERHLMRQRAEARRVPSRFSVGDAVTLQRRGQPAVSGTVVRVLSDGAVVVDTGHGWEIENAGDRAVKAGEVSA